jgi:hypothetical protein
MQQTTSELRNTQIQVLLQLSNEATTHRSTSNETTTHRTRLWIPSWTGDETKRRRLLIVFRCE